MRNFLFNICYESPKTPEKYHQYSLLEPYNGFVLETVIIQWAADDCNQISESVSWTRESNQWLNHSFNESVNSNGIEWFVHKSVPQWLKDSFPVFLELGFPVNYNIYMDHMFLFWLFLTDVVTINCVFLCNDSFLFHRTCPSVSKK